MNRNPLRKYRPLGDDCIKCGVTIPAQRLDSLPNTVLCVDCAQGQVKPRTEADIEIDGPDQGDIICMAQMPYGENR